MDTFEVELAYFKAHQDELVAKHEAKTLVLRGDHIEGVYANPLEARATGPGPHAPMRHRHTTRPYQSPGRPTPHSNVAAPLGDAVGRGAVAIEDRLTT